MSVFGRRELESAALKYAAERIRRSRRLAAVGQHELLHDRMHDAGVIADEDYLAIVDRRHATAVASTVAPLAFADRHRVAGP